MSDSSILNYGNDEKYTSTLILQYVKVQTDGWTFLYGKILHKTWTFQERIYGEIQRAPMDLRDESQNGGFTKKKYEL